MLFPLTQHPLAVSKLHDWAPAAIGSPAVGETIMLISTLLWSGSTGLPAASENSVAMNPNVLSSPLFPFASRNVKFPPGIKDDILGLSVLIYLAETVTTPL